MQRIYDMPKKKKLDTTEFFELREEQQQQPQSGEAYKIPSSSNLINKSSTNYKASFNAYEPDKQQQQTNLQAPYISPRSIHCILIADHIMDCPLCSRFYRNYTPFYNTVIMILLMALIFLFIRCQKLSFLTSKSSHSSPSS